MIRHMLFVELLGGFGDLLIALPAIQAVARSHPSARHEVLCFAPGAELLTHDPHVDAVRVAPPGEARAAVARALDDGFDLVVSDTAYDGIDALIRRRAPRAVVDLWRDPPDDERVEARFVRLLAADGVVAPGAAASPHLFLTPTERAEGLALRPDGGPWVALLIDAGMAIKRWPPERFAALGRALAERHGARILVVGGGDQGAARSIATAIGSAARVLEPGSLRRLAAVLAAADLAVAADTGPGRLAALVGTPTLMLFGPAWSGRYSLPVPNLSLQGWPGCPERRPADFTQQACWYAGRCPLPGPSCMEDLGVEAVAEAAVDLLARADRRQGDGDGRGATFSSISTAAAGLAPASASPAWRDRGVPSAPATPFTVSSTAPSPAGGPPPRAAASPATAAFAHRRPAEPAEAAPPRDGYWRRARRILVLRLDNIGDVLMTAPALRALREANPRAHLTLMASPAGAQAAPLLPWVDDTLVARTLWQDLGALPFDPDRERALIARLRQGRHDGAIVLTSFSQSPHPAALACRMAGIPRVAGASRERGASLTDPVPKGPDGIHQVSRNLAFLRALGIAAADDALSLAVPPEAEREADRALRLPRGAPFVLAAPWASAASRVYDPARLARALRGIARATGWPVVLTAAAGDAARTASLARAVGPAAMDLAGRTSVPALAALAARARLVVTVNTSVMHMADALRVPCVVLFAGTELASQWAPRHAPHRLLSRAVPCSPCHAFRCPLDHACLDVPPEALAEAALALLAEQRRPEAAAR